jgi:hypothetical protein
MTADDPYLQMCWYFEDLRDKYLTSDHKDANRFPVAASSIALSQGSSSRV